MVNPWSKSKTVLDLDLDDMGIRQTPPKKNYNNNLRKAQDAKNDEFYTQLSAIEAELSHYPKDTFKDKVIYLPTDVNQSHGRVLKSNFIEHFKKKAFDYGYKALVATCLLENNPDDDNKYVIKRHKTSYYPGRQYNPDGKIQNTPETPYYSYEEYFGHCPSDKELGIEDGYGSGDFRSKHAQEIIEETDIVVTNPPFSLFREFVDWLEYNNKKYIILGNPNATTGKEIFPLIMENKLWLGYNTHGKNMKFHKPETEELSGNIGVYWYTNVDITKRHEDIILYEKYEGNEAHYPKYDNYDAIEVSKTKEIPLDYDGIMGVPISFLEKYNPDQFEIIGISSKANNQNVPKLHDTAYYRGYVRGKTTLVNVDSSMPILRTSDFGGTECSNGIDSVYQLYWRIFIKRRR